MAKEKRFDLGAKGVNVVASPLHLADGALTFAQNVAKSLTGDAGGLGKRPGMDRLVDLGSMPILALMNVALRPSQALNPDTGEPYETGDPMYCKVYKTASEPTATGVIETVSFDAEQFDVGDMHDLGVNPDRITIPAGGDGIYMFWATASWEGRNANGGRVGAYVYKNGTSERVAIQEETAPATGDGNLGTTITATGMIDLVAGDYLIMRARQDSGIALDLLGFTQDLTSFTVARLAATV